MSEPMRFDELGQVLRSSQDAELQGGDALAEARAKLLLPRPRRPLRRLAAAAFVLTLAAGGILTELMADSTSLLVPADRDAVRSALARLKIHRLLAGYRGKPAADIDSILDAVDALQAYALANAATLEEVEVNPLICTPGTAIAADALIRKAETP